MIIKFARGLPLVEATWTHAFPSYGYYYTELSFPRKASQAASRQVSKHLHKSSHLNHLVVVELDIDDAVLRYRLDRHALEVYG